MKLALPILALLLTACSQPSNTKVIVGARLDRMEHSVIVVEDGKFKAVGTEAAIPVPKGSEITSGIGKIAEPADAIAVGKPANLVLRNAQTGAVENTLRNGEWVQ